MGGALLIWAWEFSYCHVGGNHFMPPQWALAYTYLRQIIQAKSLLMYFLTSKCEEHSDAIVVKLL